MILEQPIHHRGNISQNSQDIGKQWPEIQFLQHPNAATISFSIGTILKKCKKIS